MNTRSIKVFALSTLFTFTFFSPLSHSAAFDVVEQSALGLANAFASGTASAEDASTIWFNLAELSAVRGDYESDADIVSIQLR